MEMIDFAYDMLGVAVRAVSVFVFWSAAICALWGVATLYRVVARRIKHWMSWVDDPVRVALACVVAAYMVYAIMRGTKG